MNLNQVDPRSKCKKDEGGDGWLRMSMDLGRSNRQFTRVKTLTVDNGKEFAIHKAFDHTLGIQTHFADPYCRRQRISNESLNNLLRQYTPKKQLMKTVTDEVLNMIQNSLNHLPKNRLGCKTLHEVFNTSLNCVSPRT